MNFKIVENSLPSLIIATIFIVAFTWQFPYIYQFLIETFKEERLSILYSHLFLYTFLTFTLFLFLINLTNYFLKSKIFIITTTLSIFIFYSLIYQAIVDILQYFITYPLTIKELLLMVLFIVTTFIYGSYSLMITLFNKFIPLSHSLIFFLISILYSAWFIHLYCYPIPTIMTKF